MRIVQRNIFVDKVGLLDQKNIEASSAKDKMEEAQQYEVFRILALRQYLIIFPNVCDVEKRVAGYKTKE